MTQRVLSPSKTHFSVIRVDEDIDFVLDERDLVSYSVPTEKSTKLSRKTQSKKSPVTFPHVSFSRSLKRVPHNNDLKLKKEPVNSFMKSSNHSFGSKNLRQKGDSNSKVVPEYTRKTGKKENIQSKLIPQMLANCSDHSKPKTVKGVLNDNESSDSDIEILEVKIVNPGPSKTKIPVHDNRVINSNNKVSIKRKCKEDKFAEESIKKKCIVKQLPQSILKPSYPSSENLLVCEDDTASIIPVDSFIPSKMNDKASHVLSSSPVKWFSANGSVSFSHFNKDASSGAKGTQTNSAEKCNLFLPEMKKVVQEKKPSGKRELKDLYENLNEISWANEKSFKQLLSTGEFHRHSARLTAKVTTGGKNLRRPKDPSEKNKYILKKRNNSKTLLTSKETKLAKLKTKSKVPKPLVKNQKPFAMLKTKHYTKGKKPVLQNFKRGTKEKVVRPTPPKVSTSKMIPSEVVRTKFATPKEAPSKSTLSKIASVKFVPSKIVPTKAAPSKTVPTKAAPSKTVPTKAAPSKTVPTKAAPSKIAPTKAAASKAAQSKTAVPKVAPKSQEANLTKGKPRGTQSLDSGMRNDIERTNDIPETSSASTSRSSIIKNALKKFEKIEVANEIELFRSVLNGDNDVFSAFQRGSKLRVTLEPLEHTNLWTTDFYETFKKHVIEQALLKSIENRDQESINSMFRDLQDSFMNPPNNNKVPKKKKPEEEALRSSVRQSEGAFRYKEIVVKRHPNYMQFVLVPNTSKQNSLTIEAMKELKDAFLLAKKDSNCRAVLLNSSGTYFCTGIDLSQLVGSNRKQIAEEMASTIKDLVLTLGSFTKPVVAAVNGTAVGFGVSLLTYCDVVLASDKATFCIPATRLGYLPEGAVTLTLPQVVGAGVATEILLQGRRITAEQALRYGLVSEVMWPTNLMNEVFPRIQSIVSQPLQVMEATKSMVRCHLWDKLKQHVEKEWQLLPSLWLGAQCQHNIKRTLQTGWLID